MYATATRRDRAQRGAAPSPATIASAAPPMLFDQAVTIWAIEQAVDLNNSVVVTFRGPLRLSIAIASAGNVRISRVNQ